MNTISPFYLRAIDNLINHVYDVQDQYTPLPDKWLNSFIIMELHYLFNEVKL